MRYLFLLLLLPTLLVAQKKYTISGYIQEKGSKENLPNVSIYITNTPYSTNSNAYGFYSLTVPESKNIVVRFSFVGYKKIEKHLSLTENIALNIELEADNLLDEVVVSSKKQEDRVSDAVQMSKIDIPIAQMKKIPAFMGEKDVLKVLQLMPGVQKGSEGQSGIYVRGGGPDQNLIILDDATVYNASHLFGFFSVFNGDALKSVELTKGGFPAQYGGRLSSVIDIQMKDGSKEKLHGEGGLGLISSRLTLEGPIKKNKASFVVSARRTYVDVLMKPFVRQSNKNNTNEKNAVGYYFYDLNGKLNYDFGRKNKLFLSGYFGKDSFFNTSSSPQNERKSGLNWGNATSTLRWNHLFTEKLFANTSLIYTQFHFGVDVYTKIIDTETKKTDSEFSLLYLSKVRDFTLKTDFDYFPNNKHAIKWGIQSTFHRFTPSALVVSGTFTDSLDSKTNKSLYNFESAIYAQDVWQALSALKINYGFRLTNFNTQDKNYLRLEPRFSAAYKLNSNLSFKASYAKMNQYIHLLSNTGIGLPTDLWVPTTAKVAPQQSEQWAAGFAKDFSKSGLSLTIEGYYKKMNHIIAYKENASFLSLSRSAANGVSWEDNVTSGKGWSYGAEVLLQKKVGKFSGWVGYTLSWINWQFADLNYGQKFHPRYDRRHDISLVGIYEISKKITLSGTWVYGTGNALTLPIGKYYANEDVYSLNGLGGRYLSDYGAKNAFRAEPYHRLDVGVQFHKQKKHHERIWEISVYNAYNRKNPFYYEMGTKTIGTEQTNILQRVSLFPVVPSISYNFKF